MKETILGLNDWIPRLPHLTGFKVYGTNCLIFIIAQETVLISLLISAYLEVFVYVCVFYFFKKLLLMKTIKKSQWNWKLVL